MSSSAATCRALARERSYYGVRPSCGFWVLSCICRLLSVISQSWEIRRARYFSDCDDDFGDDSKQKPSAQLSYLLSALCCSESRSAERAGIRWRRRVVFGLGQSTCCQKLEGCRCFSGDNHVPFANWNCRNQENITFCHSCCYFAYWKYHLWRQVLRTWKL